MTAPSQNGSVLRNPPTGNVLGAWPSLFIFVEGVESLREEALPLRVRHDRTRDEDDNKRPAQEWVQNSLKFWRRREGSTPADRMKPSFSDMSMSLTITAPAHLRYLTMSQVARCTEDKRKGT